MPEVFATAVPAARLLIALEALKTGVGLDSLHNVC